HPPEDAAVVEARGGGAKTVGGEARRLGVTRPRAAIERSPGGAFIRVSEGTPMIDDDSELAVPVSAREHVQGDARAPVTLVEYGDYQCPYSAEAHGVVRELVERYGDNLR